ncbi:MAG TPA: hypothetical protein VEK34_09795 [Methylocella sp.]|nr:hypothetical protein [Methylocella sp.]
MVWPKLTVSDYPEMLRKLSAAAFSVTLGCVFFVRYRIAAIDQSLDALEKVAPQIEALHIHIPFGTFIIAAVSAVLSESIKLHDKISDALGIRAEFDARWILIPMVLLSGSTMERNRFDRIASDRKRLMNDVFYKYASSGRKAVIDKHLITQALTAWSWYWVCVESFVLLIPTAAVFMFFRDWGTASLALALMLALLVIMKVNRAEASKYAEAEVSAILADDCRRQAVKSVFDAL